MPEKYRDVPLTTQNSAATQLRHKTIQSTIKYDQAPLEARREALERTG